ncbi:MAG: J domain-containing protein [Roseibacillus sp.]
MNAWEELGLPVGLVVAPEEVEEAFRKKSEGAHPDSGGEVGEFERIREARDLLRDDFQRLELWLDLQGVERAHSGAISERVGAMFGRVSEATKGVDAWLEKGAGVSSSLGKAVWQKEGFGWKTRLEELLQEVNDWQEGVVGLFVEIGEGEVDKALEVRGELGFLRKWKHQLQARYGKIWEGLV